ncbi:MAG: hypothetical protein EOM26_02950 [Alphaproteobacteria bacterium]|nr:hypothetical protein [Alphaproteobacteria bacterium]
MARSLLFLLILAVMALSGEAHAACPAQGISPFSEIVEDGESRRSDPGTVSEGTVLIDQADLKRKQCSGGRWGDLSYDGVHVTSVHPAMEPYIEQTFLDPKKREVIESIGQVACAGSTGTGFLFDLSAFGVPAQRNFDLVLTSCHVIANGNCAFRPFEGFHDLGRGREAIAAQMGPKLGAALPIRRSISENGCAEFMDGNPSINRRTARKDWWIGVVERKLPVPDQQRIRLVEADHNLVEGRSKNDELVTFGLPLKRLRVQLPGSTTVREGAVADLVYSRDCGGDIKTDNIVHDCMTYFGMSGGPLGYYDRDGRFSVFGVNSWAGGLSKDLGSKQAAQISRGGATGLTKDVLRTMRSKIAELR